MCKWVKDESSRIFTEVVGFLKIRCEDTETLESFFLWLNRDFEGCKTVHIAFSKLLELNSRVFMVNVSKSLTNKIQHLSLVANSYVYIIIVSQH